MFIWNQSLFSSHLKVTATKKISVVNFIVAVMHNCDNNLYIWVSISLALHLSRLSSSIFHCRSGIIFSKLCIYATVKLQVYDISVNLKSNMILVAVISICDENYFFREYCKLSKLCITATIIFPYIWFSISLALSLLLS